MELPHDVLAIVRSFSRPVTRPDWRRFKPMPAHKFHSDLIRTYNRRYLPVLEIFVKRYNHIRYVFDNEITSIHDTPASRYCSWRY